MRKEAEGSLSLGTTNAVVGKVRKKAGGSKVVVSFDRMISLALLKYLIAH